MDKADIRSFVLEKRRLISEEESITKSLIIQQKLLDSSLFKNANVIASYSSFPGEVKTALINQNAIFCGKKVALPRIETSSLHMHFIAVSDENNFIENVYGVKEPLFDESKICVKSEIDLFIVPGVAYDFAGNRLGMGKGYYDRILDGIDSSKVVALAYDFQLIKSIPSETHDVGVGMIVTENKIIKTDNANQGRRFIGE